MSHQQTDSQNYGFGYGYNLASEMTSETYPSGRQVITEYDSAGRAAGIKAAAISYAGATASDATNRIQYAAHGAVSAMKFDNDLWEHTNFNSRLQPTQIGLGTSRTDSSLLKLDYGYGTTSNNGNVISQTITAPKAGGGNLVLTQNYTYDALNRLSVAEELISSSSQWKQTYDIDRWGNRAVRNTSYIPTPPLTPQSANSTDFSAFNQGNNRIQLSGFAYDAAGNMKNDPTTTLNPPNGMVYDAENRQTSYTKANAVTNYSYDGDGHRVKKVTGSVTTVFVYNASGQLTAEYTNDTVPPVGGGGTSYLTSDHLGSTRVVMKSDGTTTRHDYLPFGEEIQAGIGGRTAGQGYVADTLRQKFTQKERDNESGLDFFLARYYSSAQGRFASTDPLTGVPGRPQSWNRYAYVLNNPLKLIDPDGLRWAERKLENGNIEYGWFTTDLEYDVATNNGWSAVHFDESKPYEYQAPSLGDERYNMYRLNPDGTHGYGRILDGQGVGASTAWDMQFAIGGVLNGARIGLGAGLDSLAATFGRSAAKEATATGLSSDGLAFELKFLSKHLPGTAEASKEISKGSAHVFKDLSTLSRVESEIFSRGVNTGTFNGWTRFGARFAEPIGTRIGKDGTTTALNYGEMKLKEGLYHIIPRTGPR